MAGGRPSNYTPETVDKILKALRTGCTKRAAAARGGIGESTLLAWQKEFPEFQEAIAQAQDEAEAEFTELLRGQCTGGQLVERIVIEQKDGSVKTIEKYSHPDTRAITFWLERRKEEYAPRSKQEVSGPNGGAIEVSFTEQLTRLWGDQDQPNDSKK